LLPGNGLDYSFSRRSQNVDSDLQLWHRQTPTSVGIYIERCLHIANGWRPPPPVGWEEMTTDAKTSMRLLLVPEGLPVSAT